MPEELKRFLLSLSPEAANAVWIWADEVDASVEIIAIVAPIAEVEQAETGALLQ